MSRDKRVGRRIPLGGILAQRLQDDRVQVAFQRRRRVVGGPSRGPGVAALGRIVSASTTISYLVERLAGGLVRADARQQLVEDDAEGVDVGGVVIGRPAAARGWRSRA